MKEKLNLTIEKEVKEQAKWLARKKGISVSKMVERMLRSISESYGDWKPRKGSTVSEMSGSIPAPNDMDYDEILSEALIEEQGYEKNTD